MTTSASASHDQRYGSTAETLLAGALSVRRNPQGASRGDRMRHGAGAGSIGRMLTASSRSVPGSLRQEVLVDGRHVLTTDEPERLGGEGSAPAPHELFPAALAACVSTTLVMYARTKGWNLGEVVVDVDYDNESAPRRFDVRIRLGASLTAEQLRRLEKVARRARCAGRSRRGSSSPSGSKPAQGPSGTRPDTRASIRGRRYARRARPWCSGNTTAFQAVVTGSIPVGRLGLARSAGSVRPVHAPPRVRGGLVARLCVLVAGLFVFALAVVAQLESRLGLSPWDVLHQGIARHTPLSFGVANVCVSVAVLAIAWLLGARIGIGTVANALLVGAFIQVLTAIRAVDRLSEAAARGADRAARDRDAARRDRVGALPRRVARRRAARLADGRRRRSAPASRLGIVRAALELGALAPAGRSAGRSGSAPSSSRSGRARRSRRASGCSAHAARGAGGGSGPLPAPLAGS